MTETWVAEMLTGVAAETAAGVLYLSVLEALSCSIRNVTIAADLRHAPNTGSTVQ